VLDPQDRVLFTEALRPPEGYELSWAIGTTYTLDLVAAMAAPLAFALFDWEQDDASRGGPDAIPLLEALRRYADRLTVFVQASRIAVPKPQQFLLSYLEDSIIEAAAPTRGGLFHPKVWLLRFAADGAPVRYRFACLTRNLTFDRAWDTAVIVEGPVANRQRAFGVNRPLADFVASLPGLAQRTVSPEIRRRVGEAQNEVLRVSWELPADAEGLTFWPMGIVGHRRWPLSGRVDRLLVVSPFLGHAALARLAGHGQGHLLVSRLESLQELEDLGRFQSVYVLDDAADIDVNRDDEADPADHVLQGLHAKLYVADAGWKASVWTGSANATDAAFGPNVEFLVELRGPKSKFGIDALLAKGSGEARFSDLLKLYVEHEYRPPDELEEGLRARIDEARHALVSAAIVARVGAENDEGLFAVALVCGRESAKVPEAVSIRCWPVMLGEGASALVRVGGSELARFVMAGEELSSLFAFSVEVTEGTRKKAERFALNLLLEGAPADRRDRVLRSVLRDRDRVLRFLLFLLADGDPRQAVGLLVSGDQTGNGGEEDSFALDFPLFESLLRALEREPAKLDHVARLIEDLRKTTEGEALIPEGFTEIWDPIWAAREARR
jgi:hypothetical protein